MPQDLYKNLYMTPELFMEALTTALRGAYYSDDEDWHRECHPEDIAANLVGITEAIGTFMGVLVDKAFIEYRNTNPDYDKILERIRNSISDLEGYPDYAQANDAYVDTEADGNDAA